MAQFTIEDNVKNYLLSYGDLWENEGFGEFQDLDRDTLISDHAKLEILLDFYRETLNQLLLAVNEWSEDDFIFAPFHTPSGSTFLTQDIFGNHTNAELATFLKNKGGVFAMYNFVGESLVFVHANYGWLNCFQFKGKYDYSGLARIMEKHGLQADFRVTGRFSANFLTEEGEDVYIDDIIHQQYCGSELDEGWEQEKSTDGTFRADAEVSDDYIGDEALKSHYSMFQDQLDTEVPASWLDTEFVSARVGE